MSLVIVSDDMKTSFGSNNEELLIPVDAEAGHYGHEESSLMRSPELNGNVRSTRYLKFFTLVVVVAALFGSTMYLSSSTRVNLSRRLSMDKESYPDATKTINVGPLTTIKDIIDQLLWGPSPPEDDHGIFTPNSILIILYYLLIVNVKFIIPLKLP
jgi:hypothetical protein